MLKYIKSMVPRNYGRGELSLTPYDIARLVLLELVDFRT